MLLTLCLQQYPKTVLSFFHVGNTGSNPVGDATELLRNEGFRLGERFRVSSTMPELRFSLDSHLPKLKETLSDSSHHEMMN